MLVTSAACNERQKSSEHWPAARFDVRVGPVNVPSSKCRKGTSECTVCVCMCRRWTRWPLLLKLCLCSDITCTHQRVLNHHKLHSKCCFCLSQDCYGAVFPQTIKGTSDHPRGPQSVLLMHLMLFPSYDGLAVS